MGGNPHLGFRNSLLDIERLVAIRSNLKSHPRSKDNIRKIGVRILEKTDALNACSIEAPETNYFREREVISDLERLAQVSTEISGDRGSDDLVRYLRDDEYTLRRGTIVDAAIDRWIDVLNRCNPGDLSLHLLSEPSESGINTPGSSDKVSEETEFCIIISMVIEVG